jgi:hypothetical protein
MTAPTLQDRLREACNGHPHTKIAWPHYVLHDSIDALDAAQERIAALEEILLAIEMRTATGEGLSPDEAATIHDMANVRPTDPPASDKPD